MEFGEWLRETRQRVGITRAELARRVGVSNVYIGRVEYSAAISRPITPSREVVDRIAKALHVPIGEARLAAGYAPPEMIEDEGSRKLVNYYGNLSAVSQGILLAIAAALLKKEIDEIFGGVDDEPGKSVSPKKKAQNRATHNTSLTPAQVTTTIAAGQLIKQRSDVRISDIPAKKAKRRA